MYYLLLWLSQYSDNWKPTSSFRKTSQTRNPVELGALTDKTRFGVLALLPSADTFAAWLVLFVTHGMHIHWPTCMPHKFKPMYMYTMYIHSMYVYMEYMHMGVNMYTAWCTSAYMYLSIHVHWRTSTKAYMYIDVHVLWRWRTCTLTYQTTKQPTTCYSPGGTRNCRSIQTSYMHASWTFIWLNPLLTLHCRSILTSLTRELHHVNFFHIKIHIFDIKSWVWSHTSSLLQDTKMHD